MRSSLQVRLPGVHLAAVGGSYHPGAEQHEGNYSWISISWVLARVERVGGESYFFLSICEETVLLIEGIAIAHSK